MRQGLAKNPDKMTEQGGLIGGGEMAGGEAENGQRHESQKGDAHGGLRRDHSSPGYG